MAINYITPGLYQSEKDNSEVTVAAGTTTGAIVITSKKGPSNKRVLITTDKEFINTFGTPYLENGIVNNGMYAALEYLKESKSLYVVRATYGTEQYSNIIIDTIDDSIVSPRGVMVKSHSSDTILSATGYTDGSRGTKIYDYDKLVSTQLDILEDNSFLIGALDPSLTGNQIGIAVENSDCGEWTYKYDEDPTIDSPNYKNVFRINVYYRDDPKISFASTDFKESFMVTHKDFKNLSGKQMQMEKTINGVSKYIFIKRKTALSSTTIPVPQPIGSDASPQVLFNGATSSLADIDLNAHIAAWDLFSDTNKIKVNKLIVSEEPNVVNANLLQMHVANIAADRLDCVAYLQENALGYVSYDNIIAGIDHTMTGPSYTAFYLGHSKIYDKYNDLNIFVPNVIYGASLSARTDTEYDQWFAPAGLKRGIIDVLEQDYDFNDTEIGLLLEAGLNTVKMFEGIGYAMWTQATGLRTNSAFNRLNVRNLLLFIENTLEPILYYYVYENNTEANRLKITNLVEDFLDLIKGKEGIYDFKVECNESNNTTEVINNGEIILDYYLKPVKAIAFIQSTAIISKDSVNFS